MSTVTFSITVFLSLQAVLGTAAEVTIYNIYQADRQPTIACGPGKDSSHWQSEREQGELRQAGSLLRGVQVRQPTNLTVLPGQQTLDFFLSYIYIHILDNFNVLLAVGTLSIF